MKFSDLIEHCVTCIKSFNPVIKTIDSHADEFINNVSTDILQSLLYLPIAYCVRNFNHIYNCLLIHLFVFLFV